MKFVCVVLFLFVDFLAMAAPHGAVVAGDASVAERGVSVDGDSADFVRASIIISSQDVPIYSALGHCAIRMQCPSAGLDYCFSLELEPDVHDYIKYFQGRMKAAFYADSTEAFVKRMRMVGRGIRQYELNLTLPEKRLLWKLLDEDMMSGQVHDFNLINTNCVQVSLDAIERALISDRMVYDVPPILEMRSGEIMRDACRYSPWTEFLFASIAGAVMDRRVPLESCLSPETIVILLGRSHFVDKESGESRPVFKGSPTTLLDEARKPADVWFTPAVCFLLLLVAVVAVTVGEKWWRWRRAAMVTDGALLALQTLVGLLLVYMAVSANIFGSRWNWYLIPFNPIPAVLWLTCRKRSWYVWTYPTYTAILVLFVCATPLSVQLDLPHALLCAAMAVRTAAHIKVPRGQTAGADAK